MLLSAAAVAMIFVDDVRDENDTKIRLFYHDGRILNKTPINIIFLTKNAEQNFFAHTTMCCGAWCNVTLLSLHRFFSHMLAMTLYKKLFRFVLF